MSQISRREFVAKLGIVIEECDETLFWLELLGEGGIVSGQKLVHLMRETEELLAIFNAARSTARKARVTQSSNH